MKGDVKDKGRPMVLVWFIIYQWRRKVPKSGGGGGGEQTRNLCTFGKEPI